MSEGAGTGNRLFGEPAKVQVHLLALRQKQLNPTISSVNKSVTTQSLESPVLAGAGDPKSRLPFPGLSALGRLLGSPQDVSEHQEVGRQEGIPAEGLWVPGQPR